MKALLIIAHGSRKQSSTDEIAQLASSVAGLESDFGLVSHAFLELATPKVGFAVQELIDNGAEQVVILPYFLAAGFHVANDLPKLLTQAQEQHPTISFTLLQ